MNMKEYAPKEKETVRTSKHIYTSKNLGRNFGDKIYDDAECFYHLVVPTSTDIHTQYISIMTMLHVP